LNSSLGLFFTFILTGISAYYTYEQYQILTQKGDTTIDVQTDYHDPYNRFDLRTSSATIDENFNFRFTFGMYDVSL
jgi:hypothetical protein